MTSKIGKDFIINEDELKLLFKKAFMTGYVAERNQDYGKLGWEYATVAEKKLTIEIEKDKLLAARTRYTQKGR